MILNIHSEVPEGYYGKLADAWLKNEQKLHEIYPVNESDIEQIQNRYALFGTQRELLKRTIMQQYEGVDIHENVRSNIEQLTQGNTFTVTTGQQVHIFLGPVFLIYKITSVIRHARQLQSRYPENNYVPVFWMATEDHDVDEINTLDVFGEKFTWETPKGGAAGRLSTQGLANLCEKWIEMGSRENISAEIKDIFQLFKDAYCRCGTLSEATRFIVNHLFGKYGLVVIDPDNNFLKAELQPIMKSDILSDNVYDALQITSAHLKSMGYGNQVSPRKTHFFMIKNGQRLRIDREKEGFKLQPSGEMISTDRMRQLTDEAPDLFSPNALMRPLYQQIIQPNIAYVCGPAELHYWHQLYSVFKAFNVTAPMLFLRDSYLTIDSRTQQFLQKNELSENMMWKGFEVSSRYLENKLIGGVRIDRDIEDLKEQTEKVFQSLFHLKYKNLKDLRAKSDIWLKALEKAEKSATKEIRLQPANEPVFNRLSKITIAFFDKNNPQERNISFVEYLLKFKQNPIEILIENRDVNHILGTLCV